jgi:hypothetical protein
MKGSAGAMSGRPVPRTGAMAVSLIAAIVILAVVAGGIHLSLGGMLFTLNAVGYFGLAAAYLIAAVVSHPLVVRFSWLPRIALIGYAATSIVAWMVIGGFYWLGYLTKGIELTLIVLVVVDLYRVYGGVRGLIGQAVESVGWAVGAVRRR